MHQNRADTIKTAVGSAPPSNSAAMTRIAASGGSLGSNLENMIALALESFARTHAEFNPENGLIAQMQILSERIKDSGRVAEAQRVHQQVNAMRAYFNLADPDDPRSNDGQARLFASSGKLAGYMAVIPPRGDGNMPTVNTLTALLAKTGIIHGVDFGKIEQVLAAVREERDIYWCVPIARGVAPVADHVSHINFRVTALDKDAFKSDISIMAKVLENLGKPLEDEDMIGVMTNYRGANAGVNIYGRPVDPGQGRKSLELSDDIRMSQEGLLTAGASGYLVRSGNRLDIMPFYVLVPKPGAQMQELSYPGAVLVKGDFTGPMNLECDDLFVLGSCEQVRVQARGDIFITGGVVGHNQTSLDADGDVYASFISEADVSALGDIFVENAVVNSRLVSNSNIKVRSEKGMIAGGNLAALKSISAATIGSEFGMFTETAVGSDFLSSGRLEEIARRVAMHAENLRRIQDLKQQIVRWRSNIESLPPDKQEILLNVLRKERNSQIELKSLARRRARLNEAISNFIDASVAVLGSIYPPTRIKIGDAIRDIKEKLNSVTLKYDGHRGVIDVVMESAGSVSEP